MNERTCLMELRNLTFGYEDEKPVLSGIDLEIREGERIAVLGPNGAGKSTFFLCLNGVLTPQRGTVSYRGAAVSKKDWNGLRRKVGIVFQDSDSQMIASTVLEEVSFGPMNLGLSREEVLRRVEEALRFMNLSDMRSRPPHYLSGGEKKRVGIADILAMEPEIIAFDEPTASLDPVNAQNLERILEKLSEERKTLLVSTHDVDFAYRFAERILVFCDGGVIADGTPTEVFADGNAMRHANLKKPALLEVCGLLKERGLLPWETADARNMEEFREFLNAGTKKEEIDNSGITG